MSKVMLFYITALLLVASAIPLPDDGGNTPTDPSDAVFLRSPQDGGSGKSDAVFLRSPQADTTGTPSDAVFLRSPQVDSSDEPSDAVFLRAVQDGVN